MIDKILKYDLCIGCGLCSSIISNQKIIMMLDDNGYYKPLIKQPLSIKENQLIKKVCPGIHVENSLKGGLWGCVKEAFQGWASDKNIRYHSSSGGIVTAVAIYLLETKMVDAILHVGNDEGSPLYNKLLISHTKNQITERSKSRYAPAQVFDNIIRILDKDKENYCFIGKPCDIVALNNFLSVYPQYKQRIKFKISIFCAGIPSYNATINLCKKSGHNELPIKIKYRGDGWPGSFEALYEDGSKYTLSYAESWGKYLGRDLCYRCKICPDGIGLSADLSIGDHWQTKNGYPDFKEQEGRCFCLVRTNMGKKIIDDASKNGYIQINSIDVNSIKELQPYQYYRRKIVGWRIFPINIISGYIFDFRGLSLLKNAMSVSLRDGISNFVGSLIRFYKANGK